jgi:hypothetical protein
MLYNPDPVPMADFDAWFANDSASKLYLFSSSVFNSRKQAEAFSRLTAMHIIRDHNGMLSLNESFREQYKSALTGG